MRNIWLVTRREYAHFVLRRGFIISMLLVPAWIAISSLLPLLAARAVPVLAFAVVDETKFGLIANIDASLVRDETRSGLNALAAYAKTGADMDAVKAGEPALFAILDADESDRTQVDAVIALGGVMAAAEKLRPFLKPSARAFTLPPRHFTRIAAPQSLNSGDPDAIQAFLADTPEAKDSKLSAVLVLPAAFGDKDVPAQLWAKDLSSGGLRHFLERTLTERLQRGHMEAQGLGPDAARDIIYLRAKIERFDASPDGGGRPVALADRVRTLAPLALSGIIFFVVFMSSTMLLGSVIEDKSTRVIEMMLACVTPTALMTGKLLGAAGAALTIVLIWGLAMGGLTLLSGDTGPLIRTGLLSVARIDFLPLAIVLSVLAFLIYCSMFLMAGSVAKTPQDAQAYVGPLMMLVFLPFFFINVLIVDPNGWLAQALSYVPIYAPFILMMRLTSSPPLFDVIAGTGLATVTAIAMVSLAAWLYRRNAVPIEGGPRGG